VFLLVLDIADGVFLFTTGNWSTFAAELLASAVCGAITGFAHGAAEY
jgi:hypothetical protein